MIGGALLAAGIMVKVGSSVTTNLLDQAQKTLQATIESAGFDDVDLSNFNIGEFVGGAVIIFIALGAVLCVLALCGMCGACCKTKCLLYVVSGGCIRNYGSLATICFFVCCCVFCCFFCVVFFYFRGFVVGGERGWW